jgi:hypothetical protein
MWVLSIIANPYAVTFANIAFGQRIVLDEAQGIRNRQVIVLISFFPTSEPATLRSTRTSVCMALMSAKYRWCLTGTPFTNVSWLHHVVL